PGPSWPPRLIGNSTLPGRYVQTVSVPRRRRTVSITAALIAITLAASVSVWYMTRDDKVAGAADEARGDGRADRGDRPVAHCSGAPPTAPRELRGMWLTTVRNTDWPSRPGLDPETLKAEFRGWLDLAQRLNHNAIFVQIRPSGDAFWPSLDAPWSDW